MKRLYNSLRPISKVKSPRRTPRISPPHWPDRSTTATLAPPLARRYAAVKPLGPAPRITASNRTVRRRQSSHLNMERDGSRLGFQCGSESRHQFAEVELGQTGIDADPAQRQRIVAATRHANLGRHRGAKAGVANAVQGRFGEIHRLPAG